MMGKIISFPTGKSILPKRPICDICGDQIQENYAYYIAKALVCNHCLENFKVSVDEFSEG